MTANDLPKIESAKTSLYDSRPLFSFTRNGVPEVVVSGVAVLKRQGQPAPVPSDSLVFVSRSLLKPWQFLAMDSEQTESFWILGLSSHSGQPHHIEALKELMAATGGHESELVCPRSLPLDSAAAFTLRLAGGGAEQPSRLYHPCSGKHLVMLAACRRLGFPIGTYFQSDHPLQRKVFNLVGREAGEKLSWVTDSCGLPAAVLSVRSHLQMWENLALSDAANVQAMKKAWLENPRLVGGLRRLDSDLIEASGRRVLAKEGADGLLMVQSLPEGSGGSGNVATCFIKIASGYHPGYMAIALWQLLSTQGSAGSLPKVFVELGEYLRSRLEEWVPRDQELRTSLQ